MARPRCRTGKVIHRDKIRAIIVAKRMKNNLLDVYQCPACKGWHTGRSRDPYRCAERITQVLDRYDRQLAERLSSSPTSEQ